MSPQVDGAEFVLDAPVHVPAVWGDGADVLWAQGEPLILCGPQGVGKSTVAQQLVRARLGIGSLDVLGYMVTPDPDRQVLYIAADRPHQVARSMRRMFTERERDELREGLIVWRGPLPFNLVEKPAELANLARALGATSVFIDSLKDVASPISEERVGSAVNAALQALIEAGVEVCGLHHQRKATSENKKPRTLADVYGSTWVTAGAGSVVLLWGQPGDPVVELAHLKQPADQVGPLEVVHDHVAGHTTVAHQSTAYELVQAATSGGLTVKEAAAQLYAADPSRNQIEKARRKLDQLVVEGQAAKVDGASSAEPARYRPIDKRVTLRDTPREGVTQRSRTLTNPHHDGSRDPHGPSRTPSNGPEPPLKGAGRDGVISTEAFIDRIVETFDATEITVGRHQ